VIDGASTTRLRVLVVTHALGGSTRFIGPVIQELLERGHQVHLALEPPERKHARDPWLLEMTAREGFTWSIVDSWRRDPWFGVVRWLRRSDDYARALLVGRDRIPYLVERAGRRAPRAIRFLLGLPFSTRAATLQTISSLFTRLDRSTPTSRRTVRFLVRQRPDVLVLVPVLMPGSTDSAYIRAARVARVPSILCVPSWDNLSSKQKIRVVPDATAVWNDTQRREAVDLHEIPEDRVVVTGAQCFDHWFGWAARPRNEFAARAGFDPADPYILYVGGAIFPSSITEPQFARRWIEDLRASDDELIRGISILVRPHPKRVDDWRAVSFSDLGRVVVWPREGKRMPTETEARADYHDSIWHSSVVVGVNSSAMIESAIIGRPVLTVLVPEFHGSQLGTLHFRYILDLGGGFVRTARSLEEHRAQLSAVLSGDSDGGLADARRFVQSFVRPNGLDAAATPIFADALERVARAEALPEPSESIGARLLRVSLRPFLVGVVGRRVRLKIVLEARRVLRHAP
jgi:hypothetical protein